MEDISLHLLDIIENSIDAGASEVKVTINENIRKNLLILRVEDDGKGMDEEKKEKVLDPFYTTKEVRNIGLGIPMLAQSAKEAGGEIYIESNPEKGTTITAKFEYNHIDRRPLGNIVETLINILASKGNEVDIIYKHCINECCFSLDSSEIKEELQDVDINHPEVIKFLRNEIRRGLEGIRKEGGESGQT